MRERDDKFENALLTELEDSVNIYYERHRKAKADRDERNQPWYELVPWERGVEFRARLEQLKIDGKWNPQVEDFRNEVRSAIFVNTLTEENLPHYFATISRVFTPWDRQVEFASLSADEKRDDPWKAWGGQWTQEEDVHSRVLGVYSLLSNAIDPRQMEHARRVQLEGGEVPQPASMLNTLAYVALQELATRISHLRTSQLVGETDTVGLALMDMIGKDENYHHMFYRDVMKDAIALHPSESIIAIEEEVRNFAMPGTGIPDFEDHARLIADAGIYDMQQHYEKILVPVVLNQWKADKLEGLSPEAEKARERLMKRMAVAERAAKASAARQEKRVIDLADSGDEVAMNLYRYTEIPGDEPVSS